MLIVNTENLNSSVSDYEESFLECIDVLFKSGQPSTVGVSKQYRITDNDIF